MREPPRLRRHPRLLDGRLKPRPRRMPSLAERWIWLSRTLQFAERLLPALWPALGVSALFVTLAFVDAWRFVPDALQGYLVTAFLAIIVGLAWLGVGSLRFPSRQEGLRRLELDSRLPHRPLSTFEDKPATSLKDPLSRKLWAAHRARQARAWAHLALESHGEALARRDPYALRVAAVFAVVISGLAAGPDWDERLGAALMPQANAQIEGLRADLWVTPPEYTGAAPVFLTGEGAPSASAETPVKVPEGSVVTARAAGTSHRIRLRADPKGGGKRIRGESRKLEQGGRESNLTLDRNAAVTFRVGGHTVGRWNVEVTPDQAPSIAITGTPRTTPAGTLELSYRAEDDYGIVSAKARVTLRPNPDEMAALESEQETHKGSPSGTAKKHPERNIAIQGREPLKPDFFLDPAKPVTLPLKLPGERVRKVKQKAVMPLASHPWAGRKVLVQLAATDDPGQTGFSKGVTLVMPQRVFTKPLAKALIEQRKALAADPYNYLRVSKVLEALLIAPEKFYDDPVVFLGLKSAHWRLTEGMNPERPIAVRTANLETVFNLLWDVAVRIEDGDLSLALARLRQAQEALKQALRDGASDAELRRLMADLRDAVSAYIQALIESGRTMAKLPPGMAESLDSEDIAGLLDKLQQLTETGARDMAQNLLSDLSALLENLQIAQGAGQGLSKSEQAMSRALEDLAEIIGDERKVLDETFRGAQGQDGGNRSLDEQFKRSFGHENHLFVPGGPQNPFRIVPRREGPGTEKNRGVERFKNAPGGGGMAQVPSFPVLPDTPLPDVPKIPEPPSRPPGGGAPPPKVKSGKQLAQEQEAVHEKLRKLMDGLRKSNVPPPDNLADAGRAMNRARERLAEDDYEGALPAEREAIDKLRQGAQKLARQLTEKLKKRQAMGVGMGRGRDPLGRRPGSNGFATDGSVKVPDESALQEARRILEELRRRAAERNRPQEELDYLDRLLKRF